MATFKNVANQAAAQVVKAIKAVKVEKTEKEQVVAALEAGLKKMEEENMAAKEINAKEIIQKVAAETAQKKEEKDMMIEMTIEELQGKNRDALRELAKGRVKGYSKMNKEALIEALKMFTVGTPSQYRSGKVNVIKELKEAGVDVVKANIPVVGKKEEKEMKEKEVKRIVSGLIIAWGYQTKHDVLGDGKVLFFRPKKKELQGNMIASDSRLSRVTGDLLEMMFGKAEGEEFTKRVNDAYELMIRNDLCHRSQDGHIHLSEAENNKMVEWYTKFCQDESLKMQGFVAEYIAFVKEQAAQFNASKKATATVKKVDGKQQQGKIYNAKFIGTIKNSEGKACRVFIEQ